MLRRAVAEAVRGGAHRHPGEAREVDPGGRLRRGEGVPPDGAGALPRVSADRGGGQVEGVVRDAGVQVHPAGVLGRLDVVGHRRRLRVPAEHRVVVGGARGPHRPQRDPVHGVREEALADEPRRLVGGLSGGVLRDERAEDVADRLVERAGLPLVGQVRGVLGDAVRELVPDDVERDGEAPEDLAVPVAEHHAAAVPVRVVVVLPVVHGRVEGETRAVDRHPSEHVEPERVRRPEARVRLVGRGVARVRVALAPHDGAGQRRRAVRVRDGALRGPVDGARDALRPDTVLVLGCGDGRHLGQGGPCRRGGAGVLTGRGDGAQQVGRDDGAATVGGGHGVMQPPTSDGRSVADAVLDQGQCVRLPPPPGRRSAVARAVAQPGRLHPQQGVEAGRPAGDVRCLPEAGARGVAPGPAPPLPVPRDVDDVVGVVADGVGQPVGVGTLLVDPVEVRDVRGEALRPVHPGPPEPVGHRRHRHPVLVAAVEVDRQPVPGELVDRPVEQPQPVVPEALADVDLRDRVRFHEDHGVRPGHRPDRRPDPRQVGVVARAAGRVAAAVAVRDGVEHEHRRAVLLLGAADDPSDRLRRGPLGRVGQPGRHRLVGDDVDACGGGVPPVRARLGRLPRRLVDGGRLARETAGERLGRRGSRRDRPVTRPSVGADPVRRARGQDGEHDGGDEPASDQGADPEPRPLPTTGTGPDRRPVVALPLVRHAPMLAGAGALVPAGPGVHPGGTRAPARTARRY
ncbi:hypothetical protein Cus16_0883 [Curtobacterium sp. ER1/6]|nr:hypothetical protein Cus16_0883 [Curtobacterium sp. ER1/6]